jgi:hypothetical protein
MISDTFRGHTYDQLDAWPLDRLLAAKDLIDEIARATAEEAERIERDAKAKAEARRGG